MTYVIKFAVVALVLLAVFLYSIYHLFKVLPTSFVPNEDQGYAFAAIIMPQAASLSRTEEIAKKADAIFKGLPGVQTRTVVTGYSLLDSGFKTNAATIFVTFSDFDKRYENVDTAKKENARAILQGFFAQARNIEGAIVIPIAPPAIPGIGTTGGFEFWIQDTGTGDPVALDGVMQDFLKKARERPELTGLATTYSASTQQLQANVDREKTQLLGIPIQDVYSAIQAQFGSLTVSQYNLFSNVWWVIVQSDAQYRQNPEDLTRLYTRNNQNQMVPLSSVVTTQWTAGPDLLPHFNGFTAAKINGSAAPGYSSGDAIATMEAVAKEVLPPGYTFAWSGLSYEEKKSGGTSGLAFVFGFIIVFLVLAAQYESWTLPGAVMSAVPFGILGALLTNSARPRQRRLLPDRPAGADRPRRQERRAARVGGGRIPQPGQVDHGSDDPRRRAAAAADHHDVARVRDRLPAAGARRRRRRQRAPFDRHRHHRRHARRDDARDAVRAAALLSVRPAGGARRTRRRKRRLA